jgi:hypothetical protein
MRMSKARRESLARGGVRGALPDLLFSFGLYTIPIIITALFGLGVISSAAVGAMALGALGGWLCAKIDSRG